MATLAPPDNRTRQIVFLLTCPGEVETRRDVEDFAVSICDQARRRGWKALAQWTDGGLRVWLQNGESENLCALVQPLQAKAIELGATLSYLDEQPAARIRDIEDAPITWGTVVHARLTRDLLCALPEGAYVASDSDNADCADSLGRVGPFTVRAEQWQRAQLAGLDGGICRVLWSREDFEAFCQRPATAIRPVWS